MFNKINNNIFRCLLIAFVFFGATEVQVYSTPLPTSKEKAVSPTQRFLSRVPLNDVINAFEDNNIDTSDMSLFLQMVSNEKTGFVGYHGGCSQYRLFQDLIGLIVEEILQIPIRENFYFLRIPGTGILKYPSAKDFLKDFGGEFHDSTPHVREQILSLNISLFQSHKKIFNFTPRYFIENNPWTMPDYWNMLLNFAEKTGIAREHFTFLITTGLKLLPPNRGFIMQFFDPEGNGYKYTDNHCYTAFSGGKPFCQKKPSDYILGTHVTFPQLRLVINDQDILNPNTSFTMVRYDTLSNKQKVEYDKKLRDLIKKIPFDKPKAQQMRKVLLDNWS